MQPMWEKLFSQVEGEDVLFFHIYQEMIFVSSRNGC